MSAEPQISAPDASPAPESWPQRFLERHGRRPRVLHIGNIANYAWANARSMRDAGVDCVVLDPDYYHFASAPEWVEAPVTGALGDPFHPQWHRVDTGGFERPEWYLNGPTPFVLRELAARESGSRLRRAVYSALSRLYRRGLASPDAGPSPFRRMMESPQTPLVALKRLMRVMTVGFETAPHDAPPEDASGHSAPAPVEAAPYLPRTLSVPLVRQALQGFDIVIGYALGARFAAAVGHPRFASLELGTLRGLVFEETGIGRLGAKLYRSSPLVFVTNVDCVEAALRLGIPPERTVALPHPFDIERARLAREAAPPGPAGGTPYFLCPARHHWKRGNASWLKGNDILIRGAAIAAREADFRLVFMDWGEEVADSKALLDELGLAGRSEWLKPMPRRTLWSHVLSATAVVDQFAASAFGGVALETMALGRRLITRLDQTDLEPFFHSPPPVLNAATPEEVAARMLEALADPADGAGHGARMAGWMEREHGTQVQLGRQFAAFEQLVDRHGPAAS